MSKIKIMHLLQSDRFSGAENVVCQIMELFRNDPEIEMVYVSPDGPIADSLKDRNVSFMGLKKLDFSNVRRAIKEINPDIIHAHDVSAGVLAALVAPRQVKVVSHMHVNNSNMAKTNIKTIIYKIVAKRFQHIFWVSDSSYNSYIFKKSVEKKSSILFNVVDKKPIVERSKFAELQENYDIIFIGRMQYQKNPEKLINVFKILKDKYNSDFSAAVIGEGPLYEETCKKVERFGLRENVKMLGFIKNPMGLLKRAKVMLLTSRFEGTPMCALEAMALGVPIVSTPTDGMIDLIKNGQNGYLYKEDEKIANAINTLIYDSKLREQMSNVTSEKFDILMNLEEYKKRLKAVYIK